MAGQGSPKASCLACSSAARRGRCGGASGTARAALAFAVLSLICSAAPAESLRVRVSWGGSTQRAWQGAIAISQGAIVEFRPLGVEPDEPGSMWLERREGEACNRLIVRQPGPRVYDAAELLLDAPLDAELSVELTAADAPDPGVATTAATLKDLLTAARGKDIDAFGNRVLLERAPGDQLRVAIGRDHLVFASGEMFRFRVEPNLLPLSAGSKAKLRVQLFAARSQRELWSATHSFVAGQTESIPIEVPLRGEEGAYDIVLTVLPAGGWPQAVRQPLTWNKPVAERTVQVMVVGAQPLPGGKGEELQQLVVIDPANPRWADLLSRLPQSARLSKLLKTPLGNGNLETFRHPLGELARLRPNAEAGDVSWEAYTLPVAQPGKPHVLEIEYPSDVPQTLGISIVEPDAAGAVGPGGIDSGVEVSDEPLGRAQRMLKHRIAFWPRSASPLLVMTNRRTAAPAVFGKIRLFSGWERLPRLAAGPKPQGARLLAAWLDRPTFAENFSASQTLDAVSGHSIEDWITFHEGGTRLVEYLNYSGYGGLFLNVAADGSAIYPAEAIGPTPRFDKGALLATGQDPLRKDVVELLCRLFDRQQLVLIPAVDFCTPLDTLDAAIRGGGPEAEALRWIGPEGLPLQHSQPRRRGQSPYYNTLDPRVQEAMLEVVRELAARYGAHPSFGGVAIQLSAFGYAQLPGPEWGLDDATVARFQAETKLRVPGEGANRFAARAAFFAGMGRTAWLAWRADTLGRFYRQMAEEIRTVRPEATLYLAGGNMFAGAEWQSLLRPALPQRMTLAEAMLRAGIDPQQVSADKGIVLMRPEGKPTTADPADWAVQTELARAGDYDRLFQHRAAACLFFQPPLEARLESFDAKSPFKPSYALLRTQLAASDRQNRQRFVHSLAMLDTQLLADGGAMLALGQEDALRGFAAAYRRMPAVPMTRLGGEEGNGTQPVVLRSATHAGRTWLYAVNDSPLRVGVRLRVDAPANCRIEELSGRRTVEPLTRDGQSFVWSVDLEPYDLVAVAFSRGDVALGRPDVSVPEAAEAALERRIRELGARAAALRSPPALDVVSNSGFERPGNADEPLPGWLATRQAGVSIAADAQAHGGSRSARMASEGPVACLASKPFAAPMTGRLSMSVWLRVADPSRQPLLRLALEGRTGGQPYYRYAEVGEGAESVAIGSEWSQFVFPVDDIPLDGLSQLRVRFDLMGAGEVWIDDVQLYDLAFSEKERRELAKLITVAEYQLKNKQVADCIRLLDGYWPRCLQQRLDGESPDIAARPAPPLAAPPSDPKPSRGGMLDRMKEIVPDRLRLQ